MSKRAKEAALEAVPVEDDRSIFGFSLESAYTIQRREGFQQGYEKAEKDIISHIREQIEKWIPKDNGEEHIKGERTAFNSVIHLLKEMEKE